MFRHKKIKFTFAPSAI